MARRSWWTVHVIWSLVLLLVLTACGTAATPTPGSATGSTAPTAAASGSTAPTAASSGSPAAGGATKEIKLGAVLSLTGDNQIYGNPQRNAIQLAVDEINAASGGAGHEDLDRLRG